MKNKIVPKVVLGFAAGVLAFVGPQAAKADVIYSSDIIPTYDTTWDTMGLGVSTPLGSVDIGVPRTIDSSVFVGDPIYNGFEDRGLLNLRSPVLDLDLF